jgi:hypothetical protein
MDVARRAVEIGQILEHLHGKNGIKLEVAVGRCRNIRDAALDPGELSTSLLRCRDLVGADIGGADSPRRAHELGDHTVCPMSVSSISNLPFPVTAAKADWLVTSHWIGFTPASEAAGADGRCQAVVARQFGSGYVLEDRVLDMEISAMKGRSLLRLHREDEPDGLLYLSDAYRRTCREFLDAVMGLRRSRWRGDCPPE